MPDVEAPEYASIEDPEGVELLDHVQETTPKEIAVSILAAFAVMSSIGAMLMAASNLVYVAGGVTIPLSYYAYSQQKKLTDIEALRATAGKMDEETDKLNEENKRLKVTIEDMEETLGRLEDVEGAFDMITNTQGQSIDMFENQVKQNKKILKTMQKNMKSSILQNLLTVIIRSDTDGNFNIDDDELDELCVHLDEINGITFYEERFRSVVKEKGGDLNAIMEVIKSLLADDVDKEKVIFEIDEVDDDESVDSVKLQQLDVIAEEE